MLSVLFALLALFDEESRSVEPVELPMAPTDGESWFSGSMDSGMLFGSKPMKSSSLSTSESARSPLTGSRNASLVLVSTRTSLARLQVFPVSARVLPLPTEYASPWVTYALAKVAMENTTIRAQAIAMGADMIPAQRDDFSVVARRNSS